MYIWYKKICTLLANRMGLCGLICLLMHVEMLSFRFASRGLVILSCIVFLFAMLCILSNLIMYPNFFTRSKKKKKDMHAITIFLQDSKMRRYKTQAFINIKLLMHMKLIFRFC